MTNDIKEIMNDIKEIMNDIQENIIGVVFIITAGFIVVILSCVEMCMPAIMVISVVYLCVR